MGSTGFQNDTTSAHTIGGSSSHPRAIIGIDVDNICWGACGRRREIDWLGFTAALRTEHRAPLILAVRNRPWPAMSLQFLSAIRVEAYSAGENADGRLIELMKQKAANDNQPPGELVHVGNDVELAGHVSKIAVTYRAEVAFYALRNGVGKRLQKLAAGRTIRMIDSFLRAGRI